MSSPAHLSRRRHELDDQGRIGCGGVVRCHASLSDGREVDVSVSLDLLRAEAPHCAGPLTCCSGWAIPVSNQWPLPCEVDLAVFGPGASRDIGRSAAILLTVTYRR